MLADGGQTKNSSYHADLCSSVLHRVWLQMASPGRDGSIRVRNILAPLLYSGRKWKLVGQQIDKSVLDDTLEQYCWQHDVHYFRLCSYRTEQLGLFFVGVACSLCVLCGLFSRWSELLFFFLSQSPGTCYLPTYVLQEKSHQNRHFCGGGGQGGVAVQPIRKCAPLCCQWKPSLDFN